jgi:zinc transporter, ZIP family
MFSTRYLKIRLDGATRKMQGNFGIALLMSALAGLSTSIGAFLGVIGKPPGRRTLALGMGFSAGVMITAAFACMLVEAQEIVGMGWTFLMFIVGMAGMFALEVIIPHEYLAEKFAIPGKERVFRTGLLMALGIGIHNFPEGVAVFSGGMHDLRLGWALAGAIALHNIPEGLAVAVPIYGATGSRARAFWWGTASGLAEPAGALLAGIILQFFLSPEVVACTLAAAAGLMVFISLH